MSLAVYKKLLNKYRLYGGEGSTNKTHVSMTDPKGVYSVEGNGIQDLWKSYCDIVKNGENTSLGLAELPQAYLPVLVDVDIKVKEQEFDHLLQTQEYIYTTTQLNRVIEIYQLVLKEVIDKIKYKNLICIVLQKAPYKTSLPNGDTLIKSGFHLHFPHTYMENTVHTEHIIPRVKKMIDDEKLFANINLMADDIIDTGYCKAPWLMYGSRKSIGADTYKVTRAISGRGDNISIYDALKNIKLLDNEKNVIDVSYDIDYYLPMLLSIKSFNREACEPKSGLKPPLAVYSLKKKKADATKKKKSSSSFDSDSDGDGESDTEGFENFSDDQKSTIEKNIECASDLINMLADFRATERNEWMTVGWILYNCSRGDERAMQLWIEFSQRDEEKFNEDECVKLWKNMTIGDLTIGTLHYLASVDNPNTYNEYKKEKSRQLMKQSLDGSHYDIASIMYTEYKNEFVCASTASKIWFQYTDHHWSEIEDGVFLRQKISTDIVSKFSKMGATMFKKMSVVGKDKAKEAAVGNSIKQINKIISNLKSATFKSNVMKEAADIFFNDKFRDRLDQNPMLIAFKNGIYDLDKNIFRAGMPEDYISKTLPIDYIEYDMEDQDVLDLMDFLEKIFPDNSVRKYFLDNYCDIFVGGNLKKKIHVWKGAGDNGKSVFQLLFDKMLGGLSIKFESSVFSGKKTGAGVAAPELARAAPPVRKITVDEPDSDEVFNIGLLKKLSGSDRYWARDLFEKGKSVKEINPMFIIDIVCNENLPDLKHADQAIFNRIRVIPFESVFVREGQYCPETKEEQLLMKRFPRDENFSTKLNRLAPVFAWYLLEWRKNITDGSFEPEKVLEATKMYQDNNNLYMRYISEAIIEDPKSTINMTELWVSFKEWHKEEFSSSSHPNKSKVKEYFIKQWGKCSSANIWKGYRIKTLQDEIEEGNAIILGEEDMCYYSKSDGEEDGDCIEYEIEIEDDEDERKKQKKKDVEMPEKKRRVLARKSTSSVVKSGMPPL